MMYAKELAPNLFGTYESWIENYRYQLSRDPTYDEIRDAHLYFNIKAAEDAQKSNHVIEDQK